MRTLGVVLAVLAAASLLPATAWGAPAPTPGKCVLEKVGEIVKTATISFGQPLPAPALDRAEAAALACDLFLVLGSSLAVYPAAALPLLAKRNGAALVIVNRERTPHDGGADLVLRDEIGPVMSEVAPA